MNQKFAMFGAAALALSVAACNTDEPQPEPTATETVTTNPEQPDQVDAPVGDEKNV